VERETSTAVIGGSDIGIKVSDVESTDLVAQSVGNDGEDGMNEEVVVAER
jgi:hypothetical protein